MSDNINDKGKLFDFFIELIEEKTKDMDKLQRWTFLAAMLDASVTVAMCDDIDKTQTKEYQKLSLEDLDKALSSRITHLRELVEQGRIG